jgi:hypothetical protein
MKLAIVGGRDFNDYDLLEKILYLHFGKCRISESLIISGGAKGADSLAEIFALRNIVPITKFIPDWKNEGKSAGFNRNTKIVNECDMVLAFWDGMSRGTADTINKARIARKPTFIVYY